MVGDHVPGLALRHHFLDQLLQAQDLGRSDAVFCRRDTRQGREHVVPGHGKAGRPEASRGERVHGLHREPHCRSRRRQPPEQGPGQRRAVSARTPCVRARSRTSRSAREPSTGNTWPTRALNSPATLDSVLVNGGRVKENSRLDEDGKRPRVAARTRKAMAGLADFTSSFAISGPESSTVPRSLSRRHASTTEPTSSNSALIPIWTAKKRGDGTYICGPSRPH